MEQLLTRHEIDFCSSPVPQEHIAEDVARLADIQKCCGISSECDDLSDRTSSTGLTSCSGAERETRGASRIGQEFEGSVVGTDSTLDTGWTTAEGPEELVSETSQLPVNVELEAALDTDIDVGRRSGTDDGLVIEAAEPFFSSAYDDPDEMNCAAEEAALAEEDWLDVSEAMLDSTGPDPGFR